MHNVNNHPYGHSSGDPRMSLLKEPFGRDEMDINFQIHSIEKEAYCSVLRAFFAQSDLLSWGKEGLITELRKELNVTDIEHRQLLAKINSDESIKRMREWQKVANGSFSAKDNSHGLVTDPVGTTVTALQKRRPSSRPPLLKSQNATLEVAPIKPSSMKTASETVVGIKLKKNVEAHFSDNQQHELAVFSSRQSLNVVNHHFHRILSRKDGGLAQSYLNNGAHISDSGKFKNCSKLIEIRATDTVIQEVERMMYGRVKLDLLQVEKAKLILMEHERAILEALDKLADVSDKGESLFIDESPNQLHHSLDELQGNRQRMSMSNDFRGQADRLHGYFSEGFC